MKKFVPFVCLGILWIGSALPLLADPVWVPPKGTLQTSISYTQGVWDQYLQPGNESINLPGEVMQFEVTGYAEYVPVENLSFDLVLPIVFSQRKFSYLQTDPAGEIIGVGFGPAGEVRDVDLNGGLGDVRLGAKWIFFDRGFSLGIRPHVKFPGSYTIGELANAPGDGQTDLGLSLLAGSYFPAIRAYIRGSLAIVYRMGVPANQMELMIEPGCNITRSLSLRLLYLWINQFGGSQFMYYSDFNYYPENEEDSHRLGVGLAYQATDQLGFVGHYQQTIAGRNTANVKAFTLGVTFSF